ncbi:gamma carbonic anhydrase family protein [Candidatus Nitrotoga sp. M5]|uniref:gamma carbonic anhydrase family protein n=1 Tax=Candidatus Nitrotoga sp. M5 TaxID=2890409 RepID=UPI001EF4E4E1|nr:gamma carbonic anhydrase family protein [Candidatus Nitrotoga sp. M5]CAH1388282.1 Carbonic anhydrase or acetyltransferase, isoleucine patch superfamily [Candidatus Nitrotoga sp. M5]
MLYTLSGRTPELNGQQHYIAPNASVIGSVILENNVSIWFNVVIRGDNEPIHIGANSNVQDGVVMHTDPGAPLTIGNNVTVGHMAMLHGCIIGDGSLVGIHSTILNHAVIGRNCLIGANTLITEGKVIPDNSLVVGSPGKVLRSLREEEIAALHKNAARYVENLGRYRDGLASIT